jgi:hypothetical protein
MLPQIYAFYMFKCGVNPHSKVEKVGPLDGDLLSICGHPTIEGAFQKGKECGDWACAGQTKMEA